MSDKSYLDWPFFEAPHRALVGALEDWCATKLRLSTHGDNVEDSCRALVKALGKDGWLRYTVPQSHGGHGGIW